MFLVPADADDIKGQYEILLKEIKEFNPDLELKNRVLAISKSDMLDDELREEIKKTLPADIPTLFISAVTGQGLTELKDILWREINSEENQARFTVSHRPLDRRHRVEEEDEFIFDAPAREELPDEEEPDWENDFWEEESSVN